MRNNKRTFFGAEVSAPIPARVVDPAEIFGRTAPLELDLGCGDGTFLTALAQEQPERNFLGVERMPGRVRAACRKIGDADLPNARVLSTEILPALATILPPRSAEVCHLLFSDPWPKRRHHERRVFNEQFLRAAERILIPGGLLRVATDHADYFAQMESVWPQVAGFEVAGADDASIGFSTTFEERFRASGVSIHRLVLRKCGK